MPAVKKAVSKGKEARPAVTSIWSTVWQAASTSGPMGRKTSQGLILEAAASTFLKLGYAKTTVADILDSACISRRTFYQFFGSKEDTLTGLFQLASGMMVHGIRLTINSAGNRMEDRLQAGIDAYMMIHQEGGELLCILLSEAQRRESPLYPMRKATVDAMVDLLMSEFERGGYPRRDPLMLRTMMLGVEALCIEQHNNQTFSPEMAQRIRQQALPTLLGAVKPAAELSG